MAGLLMAGMAASGMCVIATAAACALAAMVVCLAFVVVRLLVEGAYRFDAMLSEGGGDDEEV